MPIASLPTEVYLEIFRLLPHKGIVKKCMKVCKSWQAPAVQVYYEEIELRAYSIHVIKSQLANRNEQERDDYFRNGVWTKKLTIHYDDKDHLDSAIRMKKYKANKKVKKNDNGESSTKDEQEHIVEYSNKDVELTAQEFSLLLSYMPNLKTINIGESRNSQAYLTYLRGLNSNENLLHIEDIQGEGSSADFLNYQRKEKLLFAACYNFRKTLTHIKLYYRRDYTYTFGDRTDNGLGFLSSFTQLTHLDLYNDADKNLTIFDVQKICPNLTHFEFGTEHHVGNNNVEAKLKLMHHESAGLDNAMSPSHFNRHLRVLKLSLPVLSASYINYITKYLPHHLDTLGITLNRVDLFDWMKIVSLDTALKFAQRLSTMKNAGIVCRPDRGYQSHPNKNQE